MKKKYVLKNRNRFYTFLIVIAVMIFTLACAFTVQGYGEKTYRQVTVQSGDTLWSIGLEYKTHGDIRQYIYDLKKINKFKNSDIFAGDVILIPD